MSCIRKVVVDDDGWGGYMSTNRTANISHDGPDTVSIPINYIPTNSSFEYYKTVIDRRGGGLCGNMYEISQTYGLEEYKKPVTRHGSDPITLSRISVSNQVADDFTSRIAKTCSKIEKERPDSFRSSAICSVCMEENADTELDICCHTFHSKCFIRWFRGSNTCPLCRYNVQNVRGLSESANQKKQKYEMETESSSEVLFSESELASFLEENIESVDLSDIDMDLRTIEDFEVKNSSINEAVSGEMDKLSNNIYLATYLPTTTFPEYWSIFENDGTGIPMEKFNPLSTKTSLVPLAPKPSTQRKSTCTKRCKGEIEPPRHKIARTAAVHWEQRISCKCQGGCRNGRCVCVKNGGVCGISCSCLNCENPFLAISQVGVDISDLLFDECFMQTLSKNRNMKERLEQEVVVDCCKTIVPVRSCVRGYTCIPCDKVYQFSWCQMKLCDVKKAPRNHCSRCKRCVDHRDLHCNECGRCYFSGVGNSFLCPCSKKKNTPQAESSNGPENDEEGCCMM